MSKIDINYVRAGSLRVAIVPPSADLLDRREAAAFLGVSPWFIDGLGRRGKITRYTVGGPRLSRYSRTELASMVRPVRAKVEVPLPVGQTFSQATAALMRAGAESIAVGVAHYKEGKQ